MVTRIRQLLEHKQLTPTQFADLIGVGRPVMSHILSERNKPSLEVAQRIGSAFPDISLAWLMFGTGQMLAVEAASPPATPAPASRPAAAGPASEPAVGPVPPAEVQVASPAPAQPQEALLRPFIPAQATLAASSPATPSTLAVEAPALPTPAPLPEAPPGAAPAAPKPFRAARFAASAASPPAPAPEAIAPLAAPVASPAPAAQPALAPTAPLVLVPTPAAPPASASSEAAMLPYLAEPGKAIRRIVIFYRDGSFADYQPE